jgi:hypothetical protein
LRPAFVQVPAVPACQPAAPSFWVIAEATVDTPAGVAKATTKPPSGRAVKSTRLDGR